MHLGRNLLFYGDNVDVLRNRIPSASVDLIYLDPPFNSNRSYNVLFRSRGGAEAQAQIEAFDDTWIGRRSPRASTGSWCRVGHPSRWLTPWRRCASCLATTTCWLT